MSAFHTPELKCPCGKKFSYKVARGINVQRSPELRQEILSGDFHRVTCPKCRKSRIIEAAFSYTDPARKLFIQVKPRKQYFHWRDASRIIEDKVNRLPTRHKLAGTQLRVVYGLAELRERLLCEDLKMDDRMLQVMKMVLLYEHPFLMKRPRLQFVLDSVREDVLVFRGSHLHDKRHYEITVPLSDVKKFNSKKKVISQKLKTAMKGNDIFDPKNGHFISYRRFLPRTEALSQLRKFARDVSHGKDIATGSDEFKFMLKNLPRGSHLSSGAKNDLKILRDFAKKKERKQLQGDLWEVRFGKEMETEFWRNQDTNDITTLWKVLEDLPDNHVERNSSVTEIHLRVLGEDMGTYNPEDGEIDINIDILSDRADFEDTIRHEVGHGIHKKQQKLVDQWLRTEFGWNIHEYNTTALNRWVDEMGGWQGATPKEKTEIFKLFGRIMDAGTKEERDAIERPAKGHVWHRKNFGPRLALQNTREIWYAHTDVWHRDEERAYFVNYYYGTFCSIRLDTLKLIGRMPSEYAAMSDKEFFAELYAFHFGKSAKAKRVIPPAVQKWLNTL